jgi:hypothetical protein
MRFKVVNIHCAQSIVVWKMEQNVDCVVNRRCFSLCCSYNGRIYKPDVSKGIEYILLKK